MIESNNVLIVGKAIPNEDGVVDMEINGNDAGAEATVGADGSKFFTAVILPSTAPKV